MRVHALHVDALLFVRLLTRASCACQSNGHWFLDNAGLGALTEAGEWYFADGMLHMVGNGTDAPPAAMIAAQRTTVIKQVSSPTDPNTVPRHILGWV